MSNRKVADASNLQLKTSPGTMKAPNPIHHPVNISSDSSFDVAVLENPMPVLVEFWAPWCAPCKAIAPMLDELAATFAGRALIVRVNCDEEADLARRYGIRFLPTLMLFWRGEPIERVTGIVSQGLLEHFISSLLPRNDPRKN